MSGFSDVDLISRLARGDMHALAELIDRCQQRVLTVAYRFAGNWADSETVAKDVFLGVLGAADRSEPSAQFMT